MFDDIIVFGETKESHDQRLKAVLNRLHEFNVALNESKCVFGQPEINFIGHNSSANGIKPLTDKVSAVQRFRDPSTVEEVRSFLGLVNYVGRFIPHLATISEPLRALTKKDSKFEWGEQQRLAFKNLKNCLSSEMSLGYFNIDNRTQVIADASPVGWVPYWFNSKTAGHALSRTQTEA